MNYVSNHLHKYTKTTIFFEQNMVHNINFLANTEIILQMFN